MCSDVCPSRNPSLKDWATIKAESSGNGMIDGMTGWQVERLVVKFLDDLVIQEVHMISRSQDENCTSCRYILGLKEEKPGKKQAQS